MAGMASEQMGILSIIILLTLGIFTIYNNKNIKILPWWYYVCLFVFISGWLALYLSPGHASRASLDVFKGAYLSIPQLLDLSLFEKLKRIYLTIKNFKTPLFAITCVVIFSHCCWVRFYRQTTYKMRNIVIFYIIGISVILVCAKNLVIANHIIIITMLYLSRKNTTFMVILGIYCSYVLCSLITIQFPHLPYRAHLGDILMLLAIIIIISQKYLNTRKIRYAIYAISAIYGIFVISAYIEYRIKWNDMLEQVERQKAEGKTHIIVKNFFANRKIRYDNFSDWGNPTNNPSEWPNTSYAKMFGVESFRIE